MPRKSLIAAANENILKHHETASVVPLPESYDSFGSSMPIPPSQYSGGAESENSVFMSQPEGIGGYHAALPIEQDSYQEFTSTQVSNFIRSEVTSSYSPYEPFNVPFECSTYENFIPLLQKEYKFNVYDDFQAKLEPTSIHDSIPGGEIIDLRGPLSPDAGTAFSRADPHAMQRNEEIRLATIHLIQNVVPLVASELSEIPISILRDMHLSVFLHERGINMRHLGYLRSCIPTTSENNYEEARLLLLIEIVSRTLKNLLKDFQRRWMRSEKTTSDDGMYSLIAQFLNLVTGYHSNSDSFWNDRVLVGIIQRFGSCVWSSGSSISEPFNIETVQLEMLKWRSSPDFIRVNFFVPCLFTATDIIIS